MGQGHAARVAAPARPPALPPPQPRSTWYTMSVLTYTECLVHVSRAHEPVNSVGRDHTALYA